MSEHAVYLDAKAKKFEKLLSGDKTMIIRGAAGRKIPYGRVLEGDVLYFINNNGEGVLKGKAKVKSLLESGKLDKEASKKLVNNYMEKLKLTEKQQKRWTGKRYLVLVETEEFHEIVPIPFNKNKYHNMDDWNIIEEVQLV
ncbi:MAG: hypothetical protein LRY73_00390 [Bacillus sp. (in: Bacteria)]|nr:hypothetical protein [Bacillus sp. (in: firmicutes)]